MSARKKERVDDPRTLSTRAALLECAESLFAERGIEGVSLRQIGLAIGSGNTSVVAYHFGSKDTLIQAIIDHRLPVIERRRAELLVKAQCDGAPLDLTTLVDVLYRPFFEQINAAGKHSYSAFVAELYRSNLTSLRHEMSPDYPVTQSLTARIRQGGPDIAAPQFAFRVTLASAVIFSALRQLDHMAPSAAEAVSAFSDALGAAAAVFTSVRP